MKKKKHFSIFIEVEKKLFRVDFHNCLSSKRKKKQQHYISFKKVAY